MRLVAADGRLRACDQPNRRCTVEVVNVLFPTLEIGEPRSLDGGLLVGVGVTTRLEGDVEELCASSKLHGDSMRANNAN